MNFLNTQKINFFLHDCYMDSIEANNLGFNLNFTKGIYILNSCRKYELSSSCKLELHIGDFYDKNSHISIIKFKKAKRIDIGFDEFCCVINREPFCVYLDFYSEFAKAICLKGSIKNVEFEIMITEIKDIFIRYN